MQILLVGGIHGVGKTSLCKELHAALRVEHITASALIKRGSHSEGRAEKTVGDIGDNQKRLLRGLDEKRRTCSSLLLDGHFCLLNGRGDIESIGMEVFRDIAPSAIALIEGDPEAVRQRLRERDGRDYSMELIGEFARRERDHATAVSEGPKIPMLRFRAGDSSKLIIEFFTQALYLQRTDALSA